MFQPARLLSNLTRTSWIAGFFAVLLFVAACAVFRHPAASDSFQCLVSLPEKLDAAGEPVAVFGQTGNANVLFVRQIDANHVVFGFDAWGLGGPISRPLHFTPGKPTRLSLRFPGLIGAGLTVDCKPVEPLEIVWDGSLALSESVACHFVSPKSFRLGINPLGGTSCSPRFTGSLAAVDGRPLLGAYPDLLVRGLRLSNLLNQYPWFPAYLLLFVAACAGLFYASFKRLLAPGFSFRAFLRRHAAFLTSWFFSLFLFSWVMTGGTFDLLYDDNFGNLYDHQALSMLQGRLDIPQDVVRGEAFLYQGKHYMYFGPVPALLRMPFILAGFGWEQLSRLLFFGYFGASLFLAYLLFRRFFLLIRASIDEPPAWLTATVVVNAGLGSSLLYLGSRPYVYHEAILSGIVFALAAAFFTVEYQRSARKWPLALAIIFGLLALQSRPTAGLFALSLPAAAALSNAFFRWRTVRLLAWREPAVVIAACFVAALSFPAVSFLKFRSLEGAPFKYHVQYDASRLARFGGKNFHLTNFFFNADAYFIASNARVRPSFPYLFDEQQDRRKHPGAKMDLIEPMMGIPYAMPGLFLLSLAAFIPLCSRGLKQSQLALAPLIASIPLALALFTAIAISHRYTGDFCPPLIVFAALGAAALPLRWLPHLRLPLITVSVIAVLITFALSLQFQGEQTWGMSPEVKNRFDAMRRTADAWFSLPPPSWIHPNK